jgi:hypothetical protein
VPLRFQLGDKGRLILTALGLTTIIGVLAVYLPLRYLERIQWKWIRFSIGTALFIWFSLKAYWKLHRSLPFWSIFSGFLVVHLLGVGWVYYAAGGLSLLEVGPVLGIEWGCMAVVIYWVLHTGPDLRQRPKSPWTPTL